MNNNHLSFENTEIAFSSRSDIDLLRAYWLFRIINNNFLTRVAPVVTNAAMKMGLPIIPLIKATVYKHFCGGISIPDCEPAIQQLAKFGIGTILDYSIEGEEDEQVFNSTAKEIIATINRAKGDKNIPFSVFKVTGIARFALLEKVQSSKKLTVEEEAEFARVQKRIEQICETAYSCGVRLFIDAEESWIQNPIDEITIEMMRKFNREQVIVYNTYQLYRTDRLEFLKKNAEQAKAEGFFFGAKLVRGAYMEKERERAHNLGYLSPIQPDKTASDRDYDEALRFCMEHLDRVAFCAGTHNERSSRLLTELIQQKTIPINHPHVYFSQLLGMSDHLSFNLSNAGYNVAKYVPYGPVKAVLPYLFRRANENTSIAGQMGRELSLIISERKRRKTKV